MNLLDFYKQRFGNTVKAQGGAYNGPCPLCGGESGKSDRFIVWPQRSKNLSRVCTENGIAGVWSCRQCGESGDTVSYLVKIEGQSFKEALATLGIEGKMPKKRRSAPEEQPNNITPSLKEAGKTSKKWSEYALKIVDEASNPIWEHAGALAWLAKRGIDADAIRKYKIGYLPAEGNCAFGRFRHRAALDLPPKIVDGKEKRLFIPSGIVVPTFAQDGNVTNIRIRRHKKDLTPMPDGRMPPKYMELEGSVTGPMLLRATGSPAMAMYFVTEAELDAILIHHASGGRVGALAVRTNRGKPDTYTHELLSQAVSICIALDYDAAGAEGVQFWEETYPQVKRWPTPVGKDPGDAFGLGVDIREWIAAALPPSIALPKIDKTSSSIEYNPLNNKASAGQMDTCTSGLKDMGGGGKSENSIPSKEGDKQMFASGAMAAVHPCFKVLPSYLPYREIPRDIRMLAKIWWGKPIRLKMLRDGSGGFEWVANEKWKAKNYVKWQAFMKFQWKSTEVWEWFSLHRDSEITYKNLLFVSGASDT